eukprot:6724496-Karenia_brevis.AAC.1
MAGQRAIVQRFLDAPISLSITNTCKIRNDIVRMTFTTMGGREFDVDTSPLSDMYEVSRDLALHDFIIDKGSPPMQVVYQDKVVPFKDRKLVRLTRMIQDFNAELS